MLFLSDDYHYTGWSTALHPGKSSCSYFQHKDCYVVWTGLVCVLAALRSDAALRPSAIALSLLLAAKRYRDIRGAWRLALSRWNLLGDPGIRFPLRVHDVVIVYGSQMPGPPCSL